MDTGVARKNPFNCKERNHLPRYSPIFLAKRSPVCDQSFGWSIDNLARLKPVDIEETEQNPDLGTSPITAEQIQKSVDKFFSQKEILPSPCIPKHVTFSPHPPQTAYYMTESLMESGADSQRTREVSCQTALTFPLDFDVERMVGPQFLYSDGEPDWANFSLRRKLFDKPTLAPCDSEQNTTVNMSLDSLDQPNNSYRDKSLNIFNDEIVFLAGQSTAATALQSSFESNTKFQPLLSPFAQDHPAVSEGPGNSMLPSSPSPHKPSTPANQISETPSKLPSTPFLSPINATETLTPAMISRKALSTGGRSTSTPAHPRTDVPNVENRQANLIEVQAIRLEEVEEEEESPLLSSTSSLSEPLPALLSFNDLCSETGEVSMATNQAMETMEANKKNTLLTEQSKPQPSDLPSTSDVKLLEGSAGLDSGMASMKSVGETSQFSLPDPSAPHTRPSENNFGSTCRALSTSPMDSDINTGLQSVLKASKGGQISQRTKSFQKTSTLNRLNSACSKVVFSSDENPLRLPNRKFDELPVPKTPEKSLKSGTLKYLKTSTELPFHSLPETPKSRSYTRGQMSRVSRNSFGSASRIPQGNTPSHASMIMITDLLQKKEMLKAKLEHDPISSLEMCSSHPSPFSRPFSQINGRKWPRSPVWKETLPLYGDAAKDRENTPHVRPQVPSSSYEDWKRTMGIWEESIQQYTPIHGGVNIIN